VSRYQVPCPTYIYGEAIVGWDRRRGTYFCHCYDLERRFGAHETDEPEYSIGTRSAEIPTVARLLAATFAFTTITDDTVAHLLEDPQREAAGHAPRQIVQQ
jgi:hypothetical protein